MATLSTPGQCPSPFVSSSNSDDLSPRGFQFREASVCPRLKAASDGGPIGLQVRGWSGRRAQAAPQWSGRAGGQVGCSTQAWEGCGNTAGQRPHPEFREGQSGSPGALGPRQNCSPLVFSAVGSSSQQLRDRTHMRNPGSREDGAALRSQPMESGRWAPEHPGPMLPEGSLPHGQRGWLGGPPRFLQEPGAGLSSYYPSPGRPPGLVLTRQPAQTFRARLRGQPLGIRQLRL